MARISLSDLGRTPMERLMGHAAHILPAWNRLEDAFFGSPTFSAELLEQVRRTLAMAHGCRYCQAKAGPPDPLHSDPKIAAAVELAQRFGADHRAIDTQALLEYRRVFTEPELVELVAFMGFMWAGGSFGAVLGLMPGSSYASMEARSECKG